MEIQPSVGVEIPKPNVGKFRSDKTNHLTFFATSGILTVGSLVNVILRPANMRSRSVLGVISEVVAIVFIVLLFPLATANAKAHAKKITADPEQQDAILWMLRRHLDPFLVMACAGIYWVTRVNW